MLRSIPVMSNGAQDVGWWYLSFVSEEQGWLGACFIRAAGLQDAVGLAHQHGCNPGGQVAGFGPLGVEIKDEYANRLLTLEEAEAAQAEGDGSQVSASPKTASLPDRVGATRTGGLDVVEPVDQCSRVEPDTDSLRWVYCSAPELRSPEDAWHYAMSGKTAAQEGGIDGRHCGHWELLGQIIAKAAAYGWWPVEGPDDEIVAVPIAQWVADGHPYSRKVPDLATLLDRWRIDQVVIDGEIEPSVLGQAQLRAIEATAGTLNGVYGAGYLDELREDWPQ
ncbi:hypothetical protein BKG75_17905 [Mycobacteroides chelonae]|nr:hypothetical protein BKG75_17905 [Mycobacteroides chelonae]